MNDNTQDLDNTFKAISDPTRRRILEFLNEDPLKTTEIVKRFPGLSRFAVMKHLDVLRKANLIATRKDGRSRINSLNSVPIQELYENWIIGIVGFERTDEPGPIRLDESKIHRISEKTTKWKTKKFAGRRPRNR